MMDEDEDGGHNKAVLSNELSHTILGMPFFLVYRAMGQDRGQLICSV